MTPAHFYDWELRMLHGALIQALGVELYARIETSIKEISVAGGAREDLHALWMYVLFGLTGDDAPDRKDGRVKPYQAWQLGKLLRAPGQQHAALVSIRSTWPPDPHMFHGEQFNDDVDELSEEWGVLAPLAAKSGITEPKWLLPLFLTEDPSEELSSIEC